MFFASEMSRHFLVTGDSRNIRRILFEDIRNQAASLQTCKKSAEKLEWKSYHISCVVEIKQCFLWKRNTRAHSVTQIDHNFTDIFQIVGFRRLSHFWSACRLIHHRFYSNIHIYHYSNSFLLKLKTKTKLPIFCFFFIHSEEINDVNKLTKCVYYFHGVTH